MDCVTFETDFCNIDVLATEFGEDAETETSCGSSVDGNDEQDFLA